MGGLIEYDSRNSQFNPQSGFFYRAEFNWFDESIGSDIDYTSYRLKALNYWKLPRDFSLGFRFQYDGVSAPGDERLPPYVPPAISLRGIPAGRYQGLDVAEVELQVNYKYKNRWFFSAFTGLGRAADSFSELKEADNEFTKGVGFRYMVARRYGFVMGIDVARGPEETAFYIQSGSSW